jgi:hypothetical protein
MRASTLRRARSCTWRAVFFFALLTMNSYVLFDVLDVDGSQMVGWPGDDIVVAGESQPSPDRFLRMDASGEDLAPALSGVLLDGRATTPAPIILRHRRASLLPRLNLCRDIGSAPPPSADPV